MAAAETIGFIGVGEIATAIVEGLSTADSPPPPLVLSPRGRDNVAALTERFPDRVTVATDNQAVADAANTLVIAVLPDQVDEVLRPLTFHDSHVVISALAGVTIAQVRAAAGADVPVVRAIPMPPIRNRAVATVVTPEHPVASGLFDRLGGTLAVPDEAALSVFSAATGAVSGYLNYLTVVSEWAASKGAPRDSAEQFLRGLFAALAPAIRDTDTPIADIVTAHETPGGLNEQLRKEFFDADGVGSLTAALDGLHDRVTEG